MALVVAQEVPTSSTMAVPHSPAGVGTARRTVREDLLAHGTPDSVVDDAILILSELLSNSCRHARPLDARESVHVAWSQDTRGDITISVTDGGGPTRPLPATPSVSARGGRGLAIITALARDWGVTEEARGRHRGDPGGRGPRANHGDEQSPAYGRLGGEPDPGRAVTVWAVLTTDDAFGDGLPGRGLTDRVGVELATLDGLPEGLPGT
ncbi:ATP-binding protein [Streptomyces sp. AJS327]|uniref:ATP-binding protein n=1 Tax=Streptomyces sp. AJS327 TaxID=2545265 RepID=UPI0015DDEFEE|nr:ATP-binding protein [Streptomyces sp. AJS327]MBA0052716.1 ATP-binding protein [Streptomyces sp. AJS327]